MPFDLLLTGAQVIDPARSLNQRADVGITGGRIAQVGPNLDPQHAPPPGPDPLNDVIAVTNASAGRTPSCSSLRNRVTMNSA